jgi:hypothetical protein
MDLKFWQKALREAERELDAATTRTALNAAAKKLQRAKAELKQLEAAERPKRRALPVVRGRWALPHDLLGFIDLETRLLEMIDHPGS